MDEALEEHGEPSSIEEQVDLSAVFPGARTYPLDDDFNELDYIFHMIKYRDVDGDTIWAYRTSGKIPLEELLGALEVQAAIIKRKLTDYWDVD